MFLWIWMPTGEEFVVRSDVGGGILDFRRDGARPAPTFIKKDMRTKRENFFNPIIRQNYFIINLFFR